MANLFIDVDGVVLGREAPASPKISLARHLREFLEFAFKSFDVFWLMTHYQGDAGAAAPCPHFSQN